MGGRIPGREEGGLTSRGRGGLADPTTTGMHASHSQLVVRNFFVFFGDECVVVAREDFFCF